MRMSKNEVDKLLAEASWMETLCPWCNEKIMTLRLPTFCPNCYRLILDSGVDIGDEQSMSKKVDKLLGEVDKLRCETSYPVNHTPRSVKDCTWLETLCPWCNGKIMNSGSGLPIVCPICHRLILDSGSNSGVDLYKSVGGEVIVKKCYDSVIRSIGAIHIEK